MTQHVSYRDLGAWAKELRAVWLAALSNQISFETVGDGGRGGMEQGDEVRRQADTPRMVVHGCDSLDVQNDRNAECGM